MTLSINKIGVGYINRFPIFEQLLDLLFQNGQPLFRFAQFSPQFIHDMVVFHEWWSARMRGYGHTTTVKLKHHFPIFKFHSSVASGFNLR